jgi:hypothetical protein
MGELSKRDQMLTDALRALADDEAAMGASAGVEARLLNEVRSIAHAQRRPTHAVVFALAAVLILSIGLSLWQLTGPESPRALTGIPDSNAPVVAREIATEFFPLIYGTPPLTGGRIVRIEVPRKSLVAFGLAFGGSLDGTVLADVIVAEDGLARAVRFIHSQPQQEQRQ